MEMNSKRNKQRDFVAHFFATSINQFRQLTITERFHRVFTVFHVLSVRGLLVVYQTCDFLIAA